MRTYEAGQAYALGQVAHTNPPDPYDDWLRKCQMFARTCVGAAPWGGLNANGYRTALTAAEAIPERYRYYGTPRSGGLVYFENPRVADRVDAGHVVYMAPSGYCFSTDILRPGKVDRVPLSRIHSDWGLRQLFWTDWTPSGRIALMPTSPVPPTPKPPSSGSVDWNHPAYPLPSGKVPAFPGAAYFGPGKKNRWIELWGARLIVLGYSRFYNVAVTPTWGAADDNATTTLQRSLGYSGSGADGIPGPATWAAGWRSAVPKYSWPRTLTPTGNTAFLVNAALVCIGFGPTYFPNGFGRAWTTNSHKALIDFQRQLGLPQTGQTDLATWTRLGLS